MNTVELNGKPIHDGQTCVVDHSVQTFTVVVRSMGFISSDTIKDQLQKKWEVVKIEETDCTSFVTVGMLD